MKKLKIAIAIILYSILIIRYCTAQVTGTWQLVKSADYFNGVTVTPTENIVCEISETGTQELSYKVYVNGSVNCQGTTEINDLTINTDFVWCITKKSIIRFYNDTMSTQGLVPDSPEYFWLPVTTGINCQVKIDNSIYPNPATDWINVPFDFELVNNSYGLEGKTGNTDISFLKQGIYFIQSIENKEIIIKFVKL